MEDMESRSVSLKALLWVFSEAIQHHLARFSHVLTGNSVFFSFACLLQIGKLILLRPE